MFCLWGCLVTVLALRAADSPSTKTSEQWIGYTQLATREAGGRHANIRTSRAMLMHTDGSTPRELGAPLVENDDSWTQFAGWSPDGRKALIQVGWQDPVNAQWEEEHRTFRMRPDTWKLDTWVFDLKDGSLYNPCAVDRVSHYNAASFTPDGRHLLMTSLMEGVSQPFLMAIDGTQKRNLSSKEQGFTYGFNASPDGEWICYHEDYQIYVDHKKGGQKRHLNTGNPFNFGPSWSPNGTELLFVSGEHYHCHPTIAHVASGHIQTIAHRGGYAGVTLFLDVDDFHKGSSDTPVWSMDGKSIFFTAQRKKAVELLEISPGNEEKQLTQSLEGESHYHPKPSPDGHWILYGGHRKSIRNLYKQHLETGLEIRLTHLTQGQAAMWAHWQPQPAAKSSPITLP